MGKGNFLLYENQEELLEDLSDEQAGRLFRAIFEYERTGIVPELNQIEKIVFKSFKVVLDNNREKYQKVVERNKKNIEKRWNKEEKNDTSGKNTDTKNTTGKTGIPNYTKNTDIDIDIDIDNDIDKEEKIEDIYIAPTPEEIKKYAEENNIVKVDLNYFYQYQSSRKWKSKEDEWINWKSVLHYWEKNEKISELDNFNKEIPNNLNSIYEN